MISATPYVLIFLIILNIVSDALFILCVVQLTGQPTILLYCAALKFWCWMFSDMYVITEISLNLLCCLIMFNKLLILLFVNNILMRMSIIDV